MVVWYICCIQKDPRALMSFNWKELHGCSCGDPLTKEAEAVYNQGTTLMLEILKATGKVGVKGLSHFGGRDGNQWHAYTIGPIDEAHSGVALNCIPDVVSARDGEYIQALCTYSPEEFDKAAEEHQSQSDDHEVA